MTSTYDVLVRKLIKSFEKVNTWHWEGTLRGIEELKDLMHCENESCCSSSTRVGDECELRGREMWHSKR